VFDWGITIPRRKTVSLGSGKAFKRGQVLKLAEQERGGRAREFQGNGSGIVQQTARKSLGRGRFTPRGDRGRA